MVRAPIRRLVGPICLAAVAAALTSGCQRVGPPGLPGIELTPPASWRRVEASTWMVPGVALAAWSGPDGSSLVLYRTLPVPGGSAAMLVDALANRLENLPGLQVRARRIQEVAGTAAARVEVVAPGTGDALAPSGVGTPAAPAGRSLIPTRQITLGFVRPDQTLYLTWHTPESSYDRIAPEIRATLESIRLTDRGRGWSS